MSLKRYRQKRNFQKTSEPYGEKNDHNHLYLIQKHAASHLHYDLRLELNGVLKSWAIPKGPSLDPQVKRLAVHVEDHPIEYGSFEGIIPAGEYGGGTVMLWDTGTWTPEGEPVKGYLKGHLSFHLEGEKLKGLWHLVRLHDPKNWLFIKANDEFANSKIDITIALPKSVLSNQTMAEIEHHSQDDNITVKSIPQAKKIKQPSTIKPQLATLNTKVPIDDHWLHEIKYDGYRLISFIKNKKIKLMTRNQKDWTYHFPTIKETLLKLNLKNAILDGEVVALDENGISNFQTLQNALKLDHAENMVYFVFDLIFYDGYDLSQVPLIERKQLLKQILRHSKHTILYSDHIIGQGETVYKKACEMHLEGIISKKIDSPYYQKRTRNWLKEKCIKSQEFVIGGYTTPKGNRTHFGALLLGFYNQDKILQYCGRVGTGFTQASLAEIGKLLSKYKSDKNPFVFKSKQSTKDVHWVKPVLVANVEYFTLTADNILRHPSFQGLREDKKAKQVKLEVAIAMEKKPAKKSKVVISNPDKILYPESQITKQDLAHYYENIAEWILPYIINRPLTLVRCPQGQTKKCFYQKHFPENHSAFLHTLAIKEKNGIKNYIYIKNVSGLIALVQLDVLEIHPWGSKIDQIEKPDNIIFDLDPAADVPFKKVIEAAFYVREHLELIGLKSFVKTTGGKGLHVMVPIKRLYDWDEIKTFSLAFAKSLASTRPNDFLATMSKSKRQGKIFIDYLRNVRGATAVAAYSTRARENAPVATPLAWEELDEKILPNTFTIQTIPKRLAKLNRDPWEGFLKLRQTLKI